MAALHPLPALHGRSITRPLHSRAAALRPGCPRALPRRCTAKAASAPSPKPLPHRPRRVRRPKPRRPPMRRPKPRCPSCAMAICLPAYSCRLLRARTRPSHCPCCGPADRVSPPRARPYSHVRPQRRWLSTHVPTTPPVLPRQPCRAHPSSCSRRLPHGTPSHRSGACSAPSPPCEQGQGNPIPHPFDLVAAWAVWAKWA